MKRQRNGMKLPSIGCAMRPVTINSHAVTLFRELILCADRTSRLKRAIDEVTQRQKDLEEQYRDLILQRYIAAGRNRKMKTRILDEFCDVFAYHRKVAIMWIKSELSIHRKKRAWSPMRQAFSKSSNICWQLTGRKTIEIVPRALTI